MTLTNQEKIRYSRHLNLPQFGVETQEKLKAAKVLVVGTGGLGAPMLQYLTAAGVGTIGVVDFDTIDESNLQRQVLFGTQDVGRPKTQTAIQKLQAQNPHVHFVEHPLRLDSTNAIEIISQYDVVADGTDNFPTRYLVNDACILTGKPNVYASIFQFEGQVSVFNAKIPDGFGPNYRDIFPTPPPRGMVPSCAEGGVLGMLPGIIGSIQASEVIKVLTGIGTPLVGRLFVLDVLDFSTHTLNIRKDPSNPISGHNPTITQLIDYELFCGGGAQDEKGKSITVQALKALMDDSVPFVLIDVREPYEYEVAHLEATLIPKAELADRIQEIPRQGKVIFYCKSGVRSQRAVQMLQDHHGYQNILHLAGGILAWKEAYDPNMTVI